VKELIESYQEPKEGYFGKKKQKERKDLMLEEEK